MMAETPLGVSPPSCFIGTSFISRGLIFTQTFSYIVSATSRIPRSPINAQSPPAVHILLYNARIVGKRSSCTYTFLRDFARHSSFRWNSNVSRNLFNAQQWMQSFSTAVVQIPPRTTRALCHFAGVVHASASLSRVFACTNPVRISDHADLQRMNTESAPIGHHPCATYPVHRYVLRQLPRPSNPPYHRHDVWHAIHDTNGLSSTIVELYLCD